MTSTNSSVDLSSAPVVSPLIFAREFYAQYYGHPLPLLESLYTHARKTYPSLIFLVGDSSLDNKHWVQLLREESQVPELLSYMKPDIAFHLNAVMGQKYFTLSYAVEESALQERQGRHLLDHDEKVVKRITSNDILVVSVGGNDIALKSTMTTKAQLALLLGPMNSVDMIEQGPLVAWGLQYFVDLFKTQLTHYMNRLCRRCKPKKILLCMIYFPYEHTHKGPDGTVISSWTDPLLSLTGYNSNPLKLQAAVRMIYKLVMQDLSGSKAIPGTEIVAVPLYEALNGKNEEDYVERVEPSATGGLKIAELLARYIVEPNEANGDEKKC